MQRPEDERKLEQYREQIDRIDAELLRLLNERAGCALAIGAIKQRNNQPIFVPEREQQVLERLATRNPGPLTDASIKAIYQAIMDQMKVLEHELGEKS